MRKLKKLNMIEKISIIRNPLTIIAIFAGIAEVSGTMVLPFVSQLNQAFFIYFLICFPTFLVLLFFLTLNFNNKVLYAPSDYKEEANYVRINKYDKMEQVTKNVKVPLEELKDKRLIELTEKIELLSTQVIRIGTSIIQINEQSGVSEKLIDTIGYDLFVSNFANVNSFTNAFHKLGIDFTIYGSPDSNNKQLSLNEHSAIWLGVGIPLDLAQLVLKESKRIYPHLKYIKLSTGKSAIDHNEIYIGGSSKSAVDMFNCIPISESDFKKLETFKNSNEFHQFINMFTK